jgi:hypothetical protein
MSLQGASLYDLNFFVLRAADGSLNSFSAPTALPLAGQPYLGLKSVLHDETAIATQPANRIVRTFFISKKV